MTGERGGSGVEKWGNGDGNVLFQRYAGRMPGSIHGSERDYKINRLRRIRIALQAAAFMVHLKKLGRVVNIMTNKRLLINQKVMLFTIGSFL